MEVRLFPHSSRPGVGLKPRRESQRPLLPQHARHCPVLEAGSAAGFMVYPPLEPFESYYVGFYGEGQYQFVYYVGPPNGEKLPVFTVKTSLPVGGIGTLVNDVNILNTSVGLDREKALLLMRMFVVPEDLGTPPGAVTLRGATNFQTPSGWDTMYVPIFNSIERPVAAMLVVRVETDWYVHGTEFRYVLQPGEGMSASRTIPIGQVLFVPREEVSLRDCTEDELATIRRTKAEFAREKAAGTLTTPYGIPYSPHYVRQSRSIKP